ncbi:MAG: CHAD domain-containing protein [Polyangiales bacterium]
MPFAFAKGEDPGDGARRLAHEGSLLALDQLEGSSTGDPIHETRKILKRLRAIVRLCADPLGKKASRAADEALHDAAELLGPTRDAAIVRSTFVSLAKRKNAPPGTEEILALLPPPEPLGPDAAHDAATLIRTFDAQVDGWSFKGKGFELVERGLHDAYRLGRDALDEARDAWSPERVHELRKRVKDLRYDLEMLVNAWPIILEAWAKATDELGERLGEDHDLAVLADKLRSSGLVVAGPWLDAIELRRHKLRRRAVPVARRIYAEKPAAFVDRMARYC